MNWTTECAVVIPCLSEAANIAEVVRSVRRVVPTVLVVDDGSRDDTSREAKLAGAEVLRHEVPRGKGAALRTGWDRAGKLGFHWALSMDGDAQHSAGDILKFFASAESTGAKLVVGNRMSNPEGMPRLRRTVNRWMSKRISALTGISLPDSQCGFRLMDLRSWNRLPVNAAHFEIESDVLLAFATHGLAIEFVPIEVIYKSEQSKIHPLRDTVRWIRWWLRAQTYIANRRNAATLVEPVIPFPSEERG